MSSLGNIETDGHVGITFPCFESGDVLYLTGEANTLIGKEAREIMPRSKVITLIKVTGFTFVKDALPFRSVPDQVQPSPYSPPVRFLAEEKAAPTAQNNAVAHLEEIQLLSEDLATLKFKTDREIRYESGQYVVLDLLPLIGETEYVHMARGDEKSPNEDGVRTWCVTSFLFPPISTSKLIPFPSKLRTISSSPPPNNAPTKTFTITMRQIPRGRVTPVLFRLAANYTDVTIPRLSLPILGVGGTFLLPSPSSSSTKMVWIAGGIGITPFLSFLQSIAQRGALGKGYAIRLLVATKEPQITLDLIRRSIGSFQPQSESVGTGGKSTLQITLFSSTLAPAQPLLFDNKGTESYSAGIEVSLETRFGKRISRLDLLESAGSLVANKGQAYLCGPKAFESAVVGYLKELGVGEEHVVRESFDY